MNQNIALANRILIGSRSDGVGARLCNMLWTWRLARHLQARAIIVWPNPNQVNGDFRLSQLIDPVAAIKDGLENELLFIDGELSAKRSLDWLDARPDWRSNAAGWPRDDMFRQQSLIGYGSYHPIALDGETRVKILHEARELFGRLPLNQSICAALERVQQHVDLDGVVALHYAHADIVDRLARAGAQILQDADLTLATHLRSYFGKCVPAGAYVKALQQEIAQGRNVIVFSQWPGVQSKLVPAFGSERVIDIKSLIDGLSPIQRSFLEILILSRCAGIVSANTDAAQAAMLLGGVRLNYVKKFADPDDFLSELGDIFASSQQNTSKDKIIDMISDLAREQGWPADRNKVTAYLAQRSPEPVQPRVSLHIVQPPAAKPPVSVLAAKAHVSASTVAPGVSAPAKAKGFVGRFREIISDPLNILIERDPLAGVVDDANMVVLHNGLRVPFSGPGTYYNDFSYVLAVNRGVHEPLEEFTFQELLKTLGPSPTMIELGAYWGHYSMWLKHRRKDAKVILVEPNSRNLESGRENFRRNDMDGEFIQALVGSGAFEVDRFLRERGMSKLDILHSDIQGAEVDMLMGAEHSLNKRLIDYLFVSTHGDKLHRRVDAALRAAGYRVEISSDCGKHTFAYDGFVFASSPLVKPLLPGFKPLGRVELATASPRDIVENLSDCLRCSSGTSECFETEQQLRVKKT